MKRGKSGQGELGALLFAVVTLALLCCIPLMFASCNDVGYFGEKQTLVAKVTQKHIDAGESSHYMLVTDKGVFEIDNSYFLEIYNADEIFGAITEGKTYQLTVQGAKKLRWWCQWYPYVISAVPTNAPR